MIAVKYPLKSAAAFMSALLLMGAVAPRPAVDSALGRRLYDQGKYKESYDILRQALLDDGDGRNAADNMELAARCLRNLGRVDELDDLRDRAAAAHPDDWRLRQTIASDLISHESWGYMVSGVFQRGQHRGGGEYVSSVERDRNRALRFMIEALEPVRAEKDRGEAARFYLALAAVIMRARDNQMSWRLQTLTDVEILPDYEPGYYSREWGGGAPVDENGDPVFYILPADFGEAANDGERWRWALWQAKSLDPQMKNHVFMQWARFLHGQFGVQTMTPSFGHGREDQESGPDGVFSVHTLGEHETVARLAAGVKRFKLPPEFNPITVFRQVADDPATGYGAEALEYLAGIFEDRRQYKAAADVWRANLSRFGEIDHRRRRLEQIVGNWGTFEPAADQAAGAGAAVEYRFRNGRKAALEAYQIKIPLLIEDIKEYLRSNPRQLNWELMDINRIGWRLVEKNENRYKGPKAAAWSLDLEPRPNHYDKRITITTPLQKAGAYLVSAAMEKGNTSRVVIWINDMALIKKNLHRGAYYYIADARTGAPIAGATVTFFGYYQEWINRPKILGGSYYDVRTKEAVRAADKDGQVIIEPDDLDRNYTWLAVATAPGGRLAYLGFSGHWYPEYSAEKYLTQKTYVVTDRPVYRPGQTVKFKVWAGEARYDVERNPYAGAGLGVVIHSPQGENVFDKHYTTDGFGGLDGEFTLPINAGLGVYNLSISNLGGGTFRVEEYKKPEFEVKVIAPAEPQTLGGKITAVIEARYYFGAPVTKATVKYKVRRQAHRTEWYPPGPWDWLYGGGYWWFAPDYDWYPGWSEWGCRAPYPWWRHRVETRPELVQEVETAIGPEGTVAVTIDTAVAKELFGDTDHRYSITAEVTDESRRTITGEGRVIAAREPFRVTVWLDGGYFRTGDTIRASFAAHTADGKPMKGSGSAKLWRITYRDGKPSEGLVREWPVDLGDDGMAETTLTASQAGQYRLACAVKDGRGAAREGGYLFTVVGQGALAAGFRFSRLEILTDKREYAPGEKVKLLIGTERVGGTVLLFQRPVNGVYRPPRVIRMEGAGAVHEIDVLPDDMPNFFIEAVTVSDGRLITQAKEIVVPPVSKVLDVAVTASAAVYKPGAKAVLEVRVRDPHGRPVKASVALAVYDRSVEYISGGPNSEDIRAHFWKWRRRHEPYQEANLGRRSPALHRSGEAVMTGLGVFGQTVADEESELNYRAKGHSGGKMILSEGMPAAPMAAMEKKADSAKNEIGDQMGGDAAAAGPESRPVVRREFADTAFWAAALTTDAQGLARVEFTMPQNLTAWKARGWAMASGLQVGEAETEAVTAKDLILRLQAPRFLVEKDEVTLSANVHNYLSGPVSAKVVLELDGGCLIALDGEPRVVTIQPGKETRIDWRAKAAKEGMAVVRIKALAGADSDAMEMAFPVHVHGMDKMTAVSGCIRPEETTASFTLNIPEARRPETALLQIRYSPTLAGALVDALPYLADYPYGCTEQTLNRFLPAVMVQKVLGRLGLSLDDIRRKKTNLNAQELGDDYRRSTQWRRRWMNNPVFDDDILADMVREGINRLYAMQVSDGGWGWFSGWGERSYPHTTAVVVHGLQAARQNEVDVPATMIQRGVAWLQNYQAEQVRRLRNAASSKNPYKVRADDTDALVFMVLADEAQTNREMLEYLRRDRLRLSVYGSAMLGLALWRLDDRTGAAEIIRVIDQYLVNDDENQTAYLKLPNENYWWYWYGGEMETHAAYLKLLAAFEPGGEKARRLVKYLLNNRKNAGYWESTRDTAVVIEAMAAYLKAGGEDKPDQTVEILVDGRKLKEVRLTPRNLFDFDNSLVLEGNELSGGAHSVVITKKGSGPLYFNAYLSYFSLEDFITAAGLEIKVDRKVYKLVEEEATGQSPGSRGQAVNKRVEKYRRLELESGEVLKSGDLAEVELTVDAKNDYEYLVFEDFKAAGFEPVDLRSGYVVLGLPAYAEFRDNRAAFFLRHLARGRNSLAYRLRAEIPGKYSALPAKGWAMYAPELRANSNEIKLGVTD